MNKYLNIFSNCFLTKGNMRSTIFDYQREDLYFIENIHYDFLMQCKIKPFVEVQKGFISDFTSNDLHEFISFCEDNELVFWTETPHYFPQIEVQFEHPSLITNAIIDVDKTSKHDFIQLFNELQTVGCKDVQLRFYDLVSFEELENIIQYFRLNQHGQSLELIIKMSNESIGERLIELTHKYIYIKSIVVHSSDRNDLFKINSHALRAGMGNIIFTTQEIDSSNHCGNIHSAGFNYNNISAFMEAKLYNSCLNKKVGIDVKGMIKNCPSQTKAFGEIGVDKLLDICVSNEFQQVWGIKKDEISVCKDCEFRYICSDCRIFIKDPKDQFSKPEKCNYNPYSGVWEN